MESVYKTTNKLEFASSQNGCYYAPCGINSQVHKSMIGVDFDSPNLFRDIVSLVGQHVFYYACDKDYYDITEALKEECANLTIKDDLRCQEYLDVLREGVSVPEGCTLKLSLSQEQLAKGYSSKANSPVSFVTREGDAVTDNVNGGVYAPFPVWTPVSADSSWSNSALWSSGSVPTTGDIVIDTSAMTEPISVQVPSGFASVIILGNDSILTSISFNGVPSSISVFGKVKLPVETINAVDTLDIKENVTLAVDVAEGEVAVAKEIRGNFAFVKTGAGTLKLDAEIVPNGGTVIEEGTLKFGTHYLGGGAYNSAANVRVKAGTIFDFNGKADSWMHDITLEEGSVLKNSGGNMGNGSRQLAGIILEGNATVEAVGNKKHYEVN